MKKTIFITTLLIFTTISCKKQSKLEAFNQKKISKIDTANWLLGDWENKTPQMDARELWSKKNDSTFFAKSFVTVKNDTVFYEEVNLEERNDSLFYIVSVKNQNNEKPVSFYLTSNKSNELVFENSKHDFPSKIIYKKINNDSIFAQISGTVNGKIQIEDFPMKRTKK